MLWLFESVVGSVVEAVDVLLGKLCSGVGLSCLFVVCSEGVYVCIEKRKKVKAKGEFREKHEIGAFYK